MATERMSDTIVHALSRRGIDVRSRHVQNALVASFSAVILGSLILPSLLPARMSIWGVHSLRDVLKNLWTGKDHRKRAKKESLEAWVASEREYAWTRLLRNIAPEGCDPGCVVASPSRSDPDYWYQWTRDSAMVFKIVIEHWKREQHDPSGRVERLILDYVNETKKMQRHDTPSGGFKSGGLGEVKFNTDGTPYTGSWGRPQNDGPALRASALIEFANTLLDGSKKSTSILDAEAFVRRELYDSLPYESTESIIKADLDYVCKVWDDQCFDLWEECNGRHHFNMLITVRALLDGARFATRLGDGTSAELYRKTAKDIESKLGRFWDEEKQYLKATIDMLNDPKKGSLLDAGTVLGFLHSGDIASLSSSDLDVASGSSSSKATSVQGEYLGSDKSLLTAHHIGEGMRFTYRLNDRYYPAHKGHLGYAIGRYPEDIYDGDGKRKTRIGNPWYLCTLAQAEFHYRLAVHFKDKEIQINKVNRPFYMSLGYFTSPEESELLEAGQTYSPASTEHDGILDALRDKGDAFVSVVRDWARWDGGLWEQFDRGNGKEMGAPHLTWSYASFLSCMAARDGRPMFQ